MTVHQYDIVLDVTVINRTDATMQVSAARMRPPSPYSVMPVMPNVTQNWGSRLSGTGSCSGEGVT